MTVSAFGNILTGQDVRAAITATIQLWAPTYVDEIGRQPHAHLVLARIEDALLDPG